MKTFSDVCVMLGGISNMNNMDFRDETAVIIMYSTYENM